MATIWTHEWLDIADSNEEEETEEGESQPKSFSHVSLWVQALEPPSEEEEGDMKPRLTSPATT